MHIDNNKMRWIRHSERIQEMLQTAIQIQSFRILAYRGPLQVCLGFRSCIGREASFQRTESVIEQVRFWKLSWQAGYPRYYECGNRASQDRECLYECCQSEKAGQNWWLRFQKRCCPDSSRILYLPSSWSCPVGRNGLRHLKITDSFANICRDSMNNSCGPHNSELGCRSIHNDKCY